MEKNSQTDSHRIVDPNEISDRDITDAARTSAQAFMDSPAYLAAFNIPNKEQRLQAMEMLFYRNIYMYYYKDPKILHMTKDDEGVVTSFLFIPNTVNPSIWDKIRAGLLVLPLLIGYTTLQRLLATGVNFDC